MRKVFNYLTNFILIFVMIFLIPVQAVNACTRILWNNNKIGTIVGRTMDWPESTEPKLMVFPRELEHNGAMLGNIKVVEKNPLKWSSKYASMIVSIYGIGAVDGFNEKGLAAHLLYLNTTELPARDVKKPGLQIGLWAQYVLDTSANVNEALKNLDKVQIVMAQIHGIKGTVHLVIEDQSGDSAVIEYIDGKKHVYHGKQYKVVTNDPSYDKQLAMLKEMDFKNPSSDTPLPGNVSAPDRFQRASYFLELLPQPKDEPEAIAEILAIARNVSVPFGAPYKGFGIYNTEYRTAMNLNTKSYFFELTTTPNVIWMNLNQFNINKGAKVMQLDPHSMDMSGDVSKKFTETKAPF